MSLGKNHLQLGHITVAGYILIWLNYSLSILAHVISADFSGHFVKVPCCLRWIHHIAWPLEMKPLWTWTTTPCGLPRSCYTGGKLGPSSRVRPFGGASNIIWDWGFQERRRRNSETKRNYAWTFIGNIGLQLYSLYCTWPSSTLVFIRFILVYHTDFYPSHPPFLSGGLALNYPPEIWWLNRTYFGYEAICTTFGIAILSQPHVCCVHSLFSCQPPPSAQVPIAPQHWVFLGMHQQPWQPPQVPGFNFQQKSFG